MSRLIALAESIRKNDIFKISQEIAFAKQNTDRYLDRAVTDSQHLEVDEFSAALLPFGYYDYQPIKTRGDGNCLYNCVSLILKGDYSLSLDLRSLVASELYTNAEAYANHKHITEVSRCPNILTDHEDTLFSMLLTPSTASVFDTARDRKEAVLLEASNTCKDQNWSSMIHVLGLASVLKRPLRCLYPEANEAIRPLFHGTIYPLGNVSSTDSEITIMWTRDGNLDSAPGYAFEPNHFVSLIPSTPAVSISNQGKANESNGNIVHFGSIDDAQDRELTEFAVTREVDAARETPVPCGNPPLDAGVDVGNIVSGAIKLTSLSNATKVHYFKDHFIPDKHYNLPSETLIKGKDKKQKTLTFQRSWLEEFEWLVVSPSQSGGFCKYCVLFPPVDERIFTTGVLVSKPFKRFSKAKGKDGILTCHAQTTYHQKAVQFAATLLLVVKNPKQSLAYQISKSNQNEFEKNKHILGCMVKALLLCGKQNLPIRGHRDSSKSTASNKGNFLAILHLMSESDSILHDHLRYCKKNATYTSKTIQNEIISIIGNHIQEQILKPLRKEGAVFAIIADEANQEVLSVCLRFVDKSDSCQPQIKEAFLEFVHLERTAGERIATAMTECLVMHGLKIEDIRGQAYDGAAAMASSHAGVQSRIKALQPLALFTHCCSHVLNLSIATSCRIQCVKNMMSTISEVFLFFDLSPKRQRFLEIVLNACGSESKTKKLKGLCKTRWVERHTCFETFHELYGFVCIALETITDASTHPEVFADSSEVWKWDRETVVKAQGLLYTLKSGNHIVSFLTTKHILEVLKPLSIKLQKRDQDIVQAFQFIDSTKAQIIDIRANIDAVFQDVLDDAKNLCDLVGGSLDPPRICGRQTQRMNAPSDDSPTYFKRNIAIPFLDNVQEQVLTRFSNEDRIGSALFELLPMTIISHDSNKLDILFKKLLFWETDLKSPSSLKQELRFWQRHWMRSDGTKPNDLISCLQVIDEDVFPNIEKLIVIGCTLPVGSVEAERSFSVLKRCKSYLRNSMGQERLTGLALMHMHHAVEVDVSAVVTDFSKKHHRRMFSVTGFLCD